MEPVTGSVICTAGDSKGKPYLAERLVPGVQLLRLVCYQLARVDDFSNAVQALYEARGDSGRAEVRTDEPCEEQKWVLREVYEALSAPLDERFRMLHPWLKPKKDTPYSLEYGDRGRWEHA